MTRLFTRSSTRHRAARDDAAHHRYQPVEHETNEADVDQGEDDLADQRAVPRIPDEKADADAADQHFRGYDRQPRQADPDPQPGEDVGHRRGQQDLEKELDRRQAENPRHVAVIGRDVAHPDRGIDDDRPDRGNEYDKDRRRLGVL